MRIGILGAGSIGLLLAGYLTRSHDVHLFVRQTKQLELIRDEGIKIKRESLTMNHQVKVSLVEEINDNVELLIIAVKQYHLSPIFTLLKKFDKNVPILFLQNGMGHLHMIDQLEQECVLVGTVDHGALKLSGNQVDHRGIGKIRIAQWKRSVSNEWKHQLGSERDFIIQWEDNAENMLLDKLIVNALINPLTAIRRVTNGELITNVHLNHLMNKLYDEFISIFPSIEERKPFKEIEQVCLNTAMNRSSMLVDIEERRKTEVEAILGYLLDRATNKRVSIPFTEACYFFVKSLEETSSNIF
jgi:2-dehydropantoate 2-reductase